MRIRSSVLKRKTLKQKLKAQIRQIRASHAVDHEQAGITINFELAVMQSVCMAHGIMAGLLHAKNVLGEDNAQFKELQETAQARIAQCVVALIGMGIPADVANQRILQGH